MKRFGLNNQIIIISIIPAIIVGATLTTHHIMDQFQEIADSVNNNGNLIVKQLSPAAEYSVFSGNIKLIQPLVNTILQNKSVLRIQILDKNDNSILDQSKSDHPVEKVNLLFNKLVDTKKQYVFSEPIIAAEIPIEDNENQAGSISANNNNIIGTVTITMTGKYAAEEKIQEIKHAVLITLLIILVSMLIIVRVSLTITRPINSLT
jgi:uncharacterized membrane protein affecting hemolysin expression